MRWVDHGNYFGPDRRRKLGALRIRERRRYDYAGAAPSLSIALRQLRMRVLDAHGAHAPAFADRLRGTAHLARMHNQPETGNTLITLANQIAAARGADMRQSLYAGLDRAHEVLRA